MVEEPPHGPRFMPQSPPPNVRLSIKASRLPCRVLKIVRSNYTLLCQFGVLKGGYQALALKLVLSNKTFGLPMASEKKTVTLPSAVTQYHSRQSIAKQQAIGTAAT